MPRRYEVDPQGPFYLGDVDFSSVIGFQATAQENAALIVPTYYSYLPGDMRRYGCDPTGVADCSAGLLKAIQTGHAVLGGGPANTYKFTSNVSYTGKVDMDGQGCTFTGAATVYKFTDASGSRVRNIRFMPLTTPFTILRTPGSWTNVPADCVQSLQGYQPGSLDADIWSGLSAAIQNQTTGVAPNNQALYFNVSSAAGGSDVEVYGITGYCTSILVEGYIRANIHDNEFGSGGNYYAGIVVMNGIPFSILNASLGFTLPRGKENHIVGNHLKYASLCGITVFGQDEYLIANNSSSYNGESGIKTYTYDGISGVSSTTGVISTTGRVIGNKTSANYYDGHDLQVIYGGITYAYFFCGTAVTGCTSSNNRHTGFTTNGTDMSVTGNEAYSNGTHGISVVGRNCAVHGNVLNSNCTTGLTVIAQPFDLQCLGDSIASTGNSIYNASAPATYNYIHFGSSGADPASGAEGVDVGNFVAQGQSRISIAKNIKAWGPKGTHTPGLRGSVTAGTFTYTIGTGSWSLEGDRVFFTGHIAWSTSAGFAGNSLIDLSGIPFTPNALANDFGAVQMQYQTWAGITGHLAGRISANNSAIIISVLNNGVTTDLTTFPGTGELVFSGSFHTTVNN
jgi:hypothetical protein